jgi:hypothetical protein
MAASSLRLNLEEQNHAALLAPGIGVLLERFQAKWGNPFALRKTRQIENPEPHFDSIETGL